MGISRYGLTHPPMPIVKPRSFQSRPEKSGMSRSVNLPSLYQSRPLLSRQACRMIVNILACFEAAGCSSIWS